MALEASSKVTTKGQVTIPQPIRKLLGISPHDEVTFTVEDDTTVRVARKRGVVARTAGVLSSSYRAATEQELREATEAVIAEETMERMSK